MSKYYKHPQYGHVYGQAVKTPLMRLVWPSLLKPKDAPPPKEGQTQGAPRYEISGLLAKDGADTKVFIDVLKKMTDEMLELFNKGRSATIGACKTFGKYGDGDEADAEKYPYYKNQWVLTARNAVPVKVVDNTMPKPVVIDAKVIVGGVLGHLAVTPMITAHGISYKLEAVQLVEDDGTRFGGGQKDAVELFGACSNEETVVETVATNLPPPEIAKKGKAAAINLL